MVDGSVWADVLDASCNERIGVRFLWVCVRAPRGPYVGESSWSLHKLPMRIYDHAACMTDGNEYPRFVTQMLSRELRPTLMKPYAGHPTRLVREEALRIGPRISPLTEITVNSESLSRGVWSLLLERVRSDEAEGIMSKSTVFFMVDGESGRSFHRKDLDNPWQQKQDRPRKRMSLAHLQLWIRSRTKEEAGIVLIATATSATKVLDDLGRPCYLGSLACHWGTSDTQDLRRARLERPDVDAGGGRIARLGALQPPLRGADPRAGGEQGTHEVRRLHGARARGRSCGTPTEARQPQQGPGCAPLEAARCGLGARPRAMLAAQEPEARECINDCELAMEPVAPELQLRAFSHLERIVHVPLLRLCEIMETSTQPRARVMRSSTMRCWCTQGRSISGYMPMGAAMLIMDSLTILLHDPAELEEAMGNDDLYNHVYTWYACHVYAREHQGLTT